MEPSRMRLRRTRGRRGAGQQRSGRIPAERRSRVAKALARKTAELNWIVRAAAVQGAYVTGQHEIKRISLPIL